MARLRRTHPGQPGLTRRRRGSGWGYLNADGSRITDPATRERIKDLAIPPAWQDVWIAPAANGHLQAVGTDAAGRRQYLYHPDWHSGRGRAKHDRVLQLGAALPRARLTVADHLTSPSLSRDRALAAAFRLLDRGHFRIGGEIYAQANGSFGLSTIRRDHVARRGGALVFDYTAKSGIQHVETINDPDLIDTIEEMLRRRTGDIDELLVYRDGRSWRRVTSSDINNYLKEVVDLDISAKDFRTWHGTVLAAVAVAVEFAAHPRGKPWSNRGLDAAVRRSVAAVAATLGNTPAVCQNSYINPRVLDLFRQGTTIDRAVARARHSLPNLAERGKQPAEAEIVAAIGGTPIAERAVLRLLTG
jgi:DNA topoisomerase-1